jgi:hypothetical protein
MSDGEDVSLELTSCRSHKRRVPIEVSVLEGGEKVPFCLTIDEVPIVTMSLGQAIETVAGDGVQRLPAKIAGRAGRQAINVLREVRCIDEGASEILKWSEADGRPEKVGKYRMITRLRIDPALVPGDAHMFRLQGWEVVVVVSETMKSAMEQAGCRGAAFEPISGEVAVVPPEAPDNERPSDAVHRAMVRAIEEQVGEFREESLVPIVGFSAGGPLAFRVTDVRDGFASYLSCELVDEQMKRKLRAPYELLATCDDEGWVMERLSRIAELGLEKRLDHGHTFDFGQDAAAGPIQGVALELAATVRVAGKRYRVLRCHGLLRPELEFARERSVDLLLGKLRAAGVYPRISATRSRSVV